MGHDHPQVLVLTAPVDPTADMVLLHLARAGVASARFDTAHFPTELSLSARLGPADSWRVSIGDTCLDDVSAVYYRRPGRFVFNRAVPSDAIGWCEGQARYGFWGVLESLPALWINHPTRVGWAEYKPRQLDAAIAAGLCVPPTLVTNRPEEAAAFAAEHRGEIITKVLYARVPRDDTDNPRGIVYTVAVPPDRVGDQSIALTAHLFQAKVTKATDIRVTVVGERQFAAELYPADGPPGELDWRQHHEQIGYRPCPIPANVAHGVTTLMGRLGLRFGALDFILTPDGQWVFLEINPNGQWAWIERATGLPIAAAMADLLGAAA